MAIMRDKETGATTIIEMRGIVRIVTLIETTAITKILGISAIMMGTETAPMTIVAITGTTNTEAISIDIMAIGGPGRSGTDTREITRTFTDMAAITAKTLI